MKLKLMLGILMLVSTVFVQAQNIIRNQSKWFDGSVLYTANMHNGMILFRGESKQDKECIFMLQEEKGGYSLVPAFYDQEMPIRGQFGSKVEYIREEGMYFLAVKGSENETIWTLTLTPDNLENSLKQEQFAEEQPVEEMLSGYLMNTTYLARFSKLELKGMEALLEGKGARSIIERTNLSLIRSELKVSDSERLKVENREVTSEDTGKKYVSNALEFVDALKNGAYIVLKEGTLLNLSMVLNDLDYFSTGRKRYMESASNIQDTENVQIVSESVFNGRQLTLMNLQDVTIVGEKNASILVEPPYAYVLNFVNCKNITLENLTLGHTEEGYCTGGVVGLTNCSLVNITKCDIFGCGAYGIVADETESLTVTKSIIRDCSYGVMEIRSGKNICFDTCDFIRNKQFTMVYVDEMSNEVRFFNCRFAQNKGVLFDFGMKVKMEGCEIHHADGEAIGTENMIEYVGGRNRFFIDDKPLSNPVAWVMNANGRLDALDFVSGKGLPEPMVYGEWKQYDSTFLVIPASPTSRLELWKSKLGDNYDSVKDGEAPILKAAKGQPLIFSYEVPEIIPLLMVVCIEEDGESSQWIPMFSGDDGSLITDAEYVKIEPVFY